MKNKLKGNWEFLILGCCLLLLLILAFTLKGTGDDGDGVMHFVFSHWAFSHPSNFFNHWAKPIFTMLSAPFAYFGFTYMKVFNILCWLGQVYFTLRIARTLRLNFVWLIPILAILAPMNVTHTLSSLTEPLFACWLMISIWMFFQNRPIWGVILVSFLPFIRSEGLIVCCPILIYLLLNRKWFLIPLLSVGHIVMGVIGAYYNGTVMWVINRIPYAVGQSAYGHGTWYDMGIRMPEVIGYAQCLFLIIGLLYGFFILFAKLKWIKPNPSFDESWLIYGVFIAYFLAHTIYWWQGILNSAGMMRVFIGVIPLIFLIELRGINYISNGLKEKKVFLTSSIVGATCLLLLGLSLLYPKRWILDIQYNASQKTFVDIKNYLETTDPEFRSNKIIYMNAPTAFVELGYDYFDRNMVRHGKRLMLDEPRSSGYVIFDDYIMPGESSIKLEDVKNLPFLEYVRAFDGWTKQEGKRTTHLFKIRQTTSEKDWSHNVIQQIEKEKWMLKEGKEAIGLSAGPNESTPVFNIDLGGFPSSDTLFCNLEYYATKDGNNVKLPGMLPQAIHSDWTQLDWIGQEMIPEKTHPGWNHWSMAFPLPKNKLENRQFSFAVWNPTPDTLYLAKFTVSANR